MLHGSLHRGAEPFLSMFARCCAKKSEDHDAKAECSNGMHTSYLVDKGSKTVHVMWTFNAQHVARYNIL